MSYLILHVEGETVTATVLDVDHDLPHPDHSGRVTHTVRLDGGARKGQVVHVYADPADVHN